MDVFVNGKAGLLLDTFDQLKVPVFMIDGNRTVVSSNHTASAVFGYAPDEFTGMDLAGIISRDEAGESLCRKKNGETFSARISLVPQGADGKSLLVAEDISDRKALEREVARMTGELSIFNLISELSSIISSSLSIGTVFRIMVSEIRKMIGYSRASLLLFNEKENNLLIFALDTDMKTVMKKGVKAPIEGTSAGWVIKNNRPWINEDLNKLRFPLDGKLFDEGIRSTISIPLIHDKVLGVFNLDSTEPLKYSERDLQILLPAA